MDASSSVTVAQLLTPVTVLGAMMIYLTSAGFPILECGLVRSKNATMAMFKTFFIIMTSVIGFWTLGYGFAFGTNDDNEFIGTEFFALSDLNATGQRLITSDTELERTHYTKWIVVSAMAVVTSLIPAGALAERCYLPVYLFYSLFLSAFIFPVAVHWTQPQGFLFDGVKYTEDEIDFKTRYQDSGLCGPVHVISGAVALAAVLTLGARTGRFPKSEKSRLISSHSTPLMAIGALMSWVCLMLMNTLPGLPGMFLLVPRSAVNCVISAASSCMFTMLIYQVLSFYLPGKRSKTALHTAINGMLVGLVSVSGASYSAEPWGACVIGVIGAVAYHLWSWVLCFVKIDDPTDTVPVHAGAGIWGVLATSFFQKDIGMVYEWDKHSGMHLAWNLVGASVMFAWGFILSLLVFGILKLFNQLRVTKRLESRGLDDKRLREPAYPPVAYEEAARSSVPRSNYDYSSAYSMMMPLGLPAPASVYQYPSLPRPLQHIPAIA